MADITVKSTLAKKEDGGFPVAIWDKDPAYKAQTVENKDGEDVELPEGELYIADDQEHKVPVTPAVSAAIASGVLVEYRGGKPVSGAEEEPAPAPTAHTTKK